MLGFSVPEIYRHSSRQTVCIAATQLSYATLYHYVTVDMDIMEYQDGSNTADHNTEIGIRDETFFGLDVWTTDTEGAIYCAGISFPLKVLMINIYIPLLLILYYIR